MQIPNSLLLLHYLPRNTFIDKASKEKRTGIVKAKYKLLFKHHKELNSYVFFVLTSEKFACVRERTCSILKEDWEEVVGTYLSADCSYIDVQKHDVMNENELIEKASNTTSGFSYAGKLCQIKFSELHGIVRNYIHSSTPKTDYTIRNILRGIMAEDKTGVFIKKYNI